MKRPSFQFYPGDWKLNAKLRRCSVAARGAWMDILCVLHDEDEYGVARYPRDELASAAGVASRLAAELAQKGVLKGADTGAVSYIHTRSHAGKEEDVTLLSTGGPCWFSSRMLKDEWHRSVRGGATRFTAENQPTGSPTRRVGERQGDGASTSSSSSPSEDSSSLRSEHRRVPKKSFEPPDWVPREAWDGFVEMRKRIRLPLTERAAALTVAKLAKLRDQHHDPTEVLNQSVMSGWKGIFPIKNETQNGKSKQPSAHDKFLAAAFSIASDGDGSADRGEDQGDRGSSGETSRALLPPRLHGGTG